jgi:hypothetical protein
MTVTTAATAFANVRLDIDGALARRNAADVAAHREEPVLGRKGGAGDGLLATRAAALPGNRTKRCIY